MTSKILIVGVLDVPTSTNVAMKRGFEEEGYEVDEYNYRTVIKQLGSVELMWEDFGKFITNHRLKSVSYDLIVFCKVNGMHPTLLDFATKAGPTWYWFMDNMEMAKKIGATSLAQNATFASSTASNVTERFSIVNKRSHHIIEGYDPEVYYYEDLKKIHDFLFIGHATPERKRELVRLYAMAPHRTFTIFGDGWDRLKTMPGFIINPPVYGEDERIEINQAKFVLNLVHDEYIFSDRVTKALGCGAAIISQYSKDLDSVFGDITYSYASYEDFADSARFSMLLMTREESQNIATRIANTYSWKAVCGQILDIVEDNK